MPPTFSRFFDPTAGRELCFNAMRACWAAQRSEYMRKLAHAAITDLKSILERPEGTDGAVRWTEFARAVHVFVGPRTRKPKTTDGALSDAYLDDMLMRHLCTADATILRESKVVLGAKDYLKEVIPNVRAGLVRWGGFVE